MSYWSDHFEATMNPRELAFLVNTVMNIIIPPEAAESIVPPEWAEPISEEDLQEQVRKALEVSPMWAHLSTFDTIFLPLSKKMWGAAAYLEAYGTFLKRLSAEGSPELEYLCTAVAWVRTNYEDIDEDMRTRLKLAVEDEVGQPVRVLKPASASSIPTR